MQESPPPIRDGKAPKQLLGEWMQVYRGPQNAAQVRVHSSLIIRMAPVVTTLRIASIPCRLNDFHVHNRDFVSELTLNSGGSS